MTNGLRSLALLGMTVAVVLYAASASAQATRTWVSGVGDDVNPCSRTAPCKTFAGAISKTAAGGEINCVDPGGFGGVTITKSLTIDCANVEAGVLVSGTNGITVNAGAGGVVTLRGLDIIGTVATPALNGVNFITGDALIVEKCTIREFLSPAPNGFGILFQPSGTSKLYVSNTTFSNNGSGATGGAVLIKPSGSATTKATLSKIFVAHNTSGITADGSATTGVTHTVVVDSVLAGSSVSGAAIFTPAAGGGITTMMLDRVSVADNITGALSSGPKSFVYLTNTTVFGNSTGLSAPSSGSILSYKTNNINGGNSPTDGAPTGTLLQD